MEAGALGNIQLQWRDLEAQWRRYEPGISWTTIVLGACCALWLCFAHEPPGYAIGLLAVVVAVMALVTPTALQKIGVIVLAGLLFFLETRSISEERAAQERQHVADMSGLNHQLGTILSTNRDGIAGILGNAQRQFGITQDNFNGVLSKDEKIRDISAKNLNAATLTLNNITGKDAFPYVYIRELKSDGSIILSIINAGNFPLTGVDVEILHKGLPDGGRNHVNIGTLPPHGFKILPFPIAPEVENNQVDGPIDVYFILMGAQNGEFAETMMYRKNEKTGHLEFYTTVMAYDMGTIGRKFTKQELKRVPSQTRLTLPWTDAILLK